MSIQHVPAIFVICSCFLSEILESDADDPLVIIDQQNAEEETRLPNAHSATFVMGFIFLCLFVYGIYRIYKCHCIHKKPPLSDPGNTGDDPSETATKGHEKVYPRTQRLSCYLWTEKAKTQYPCM
ncbi:uncharacterized protein CEXT_172501 [Caerostris extrusa]|uniref:Uncharacterized protein n=1 Tax=Caerostris extrusa TaxID=172846 RepID=A0AAV4VIF2_CAEEX|nr:uncharacterized protein CEXT_172501 [Caerostris extrusa]